MNNILQQNETMDDVIRRLEASFDDIRGIAPMAFWYEHLNENGSIQDIHFSDAMRRMLGYASKEDFPDTLDTLKTFIHPDDVHIMLEHAIEAATGRIDKYDVQYRIRKASGEYLWCNVTGQVIKDRKGRNIGMYGAFIDISQEMELQKKLETERHSHELASGGDSKTMLRRVTEKLMSEYDALYIVNLDRNEIRPVRASRVSDAGDISKVSPYDQTAKKFMKTVAPKYRRDWQNFADPEYFKQYMAESDHREYVYELPGAKQSMRRLTVDVIERVGGVPSSLLLSFVGIDDERAQTILLHRAMAETSRHNKLKADAFDFMIRNDDIEAFIDFFSERVIDLYGCDQVIYRDIEGREIVRERPGTKPLDFSLCKDCPHYAFDAPVYADGFAAIEDCRIGHKGIPVHTNCRIRAALTYLVYEGDKVFGYVALHYLEQTHPFTDEEKHTFDRVAKFMSEILTRRNERRIMETAQADAQKANRRTEALEQVLDADSVFVIDCVQDTRRTVHDRAYGADKYSDTEKYSTAMARYVDTCVADGDRQMMREATDRAIMLERLKDQEEYRVEYRDTTTGTHLFYEMKVARHSDTEVVQSFKEKDREVINRMILRNLQHDYFAIFGVDLDTGLMRIVKDESKDLLGKIGTIRPYEPAMEFFASHFPDGDKRKMFFQRISKIDHLKQRFAKEDKATYHYLGALTDATKWCGVTELVLTRHDDGTPSLFVIAFSLLDEEAASRAKLQEQLLEANRHNELLYEIIRGNRWTYEINAQGEITDTRIKGSIDNYSDHERSDNPLIWFELVHPEDRERVTAEFMAAIQDPSGNTPYESSFRLKDKDGAFRWMKSSARVFCREDGTREIFGMSVDITDQIEKERKRVSAANDQILSDVTQALFSFNLTVDLETGSFKLITGTGGKEAIAVMKTAKSYRELYRKMMARIRPEYQDRMRELISLDYLSMNRSHLGYFRTEEYQTVGDDETSLWGEINVTFGRNDSGRPVANLLGRDITAARREQALQEREIKATQARNEILSGVTQALYGSNLTINLAADTFTLITGTGDEQLCDLIKPCLGRPYTELVDLFVTLVPEKYRETTFRATGRDVLLGQRHRRGHLGTWTIPWQAPDGTIQWLESNAFMGENEKGEPIANLLERNVTEQVEQNLQQEREREAAAAKDRILSEITQSLYGYNLTVNLKTLKYSVITGTGMDAACEVFQGSEDYAEAIRAKLEFVVPKDRERIARLMQPEALTKMVSDGVSGSIGASTYEANVNGEHQWHETNIFIGTDASGDPIANILGRNITEQHNEQERREHEARAVAAKDQILSGITQALYGYNITVNLDTRASSVIRGTGLDDIVNVLENYHDYDQLTTECLQRIPQEQQAKAMSLLSIDAMRKLARQGVSGFAGNVEYQCGMNGSPWQWHEVNLFIGSDENGHPVANLLARNVTEQHNEQERREHEARAAAAKDQILSGITQALYGFNVTINLDTLDCSVIRGTGMDCIVDVMEKDPVFTTIFSECEKRIPKEQLPKAQALLSLKAMRKLAQDGVLGFAGSLEHESICPIHGRHWHEVNLFLSSDENGHPLANILARDVTEQHERQEQQEREREAANAKDRILSEITQSLYGYNLTVNLRTLKYSVITGTGMDAVCEVFKKSDDYAEAVRAKLEFVVPNDRERIAQFLEPEALKTVAEEGSSGALAAVVYEANVNGEQQWHETNVFVGTDANGDPIANILGRNITEQRTRAEAETQLLAAQEANKAKTAFLFNMSHDIRTPMNAIRGFTDIAKKNLDDRARLVDCLNKIDNSGELLLSLINSVLDMSRVESGKAKLEEIPGSVTDSFANIETTMQVLAKAKGISLSFAYGNITDRDIYADFDRCNRIFVNIISNAIKYSKPNGYVKVSCEQAEPAKNGRAWYHYIFEDNGIGMSDEFLGHLFEEFARERNSTTSGIQGTGLGMSLCKSFVELMGGTIVCKSKQGVGTTFTVTLPFRIQEKAAGQDSSSGHADKIHTQETEKLKLDDLKGKRILLVEDNELNREVAEFQLEDNGFAVEAVEDGSIAVGRVREKGLEYYDFILMDIQMPIMGGYEATRLIRAEGFARPIIALSANAFAEDKAASIASGMDAHVAKPINMKVLLEALSEAINKKK